MGFHPLEQQRIFQALYPMSVMFVVLRCHPLVISRNTIVGLLALAPIAFGTTLCAAQILDYSDCTVIDQQTAEDSGPLTREEDIAKHTDEFLKQTSEMTKCEHPSEGVGSGGQDTSGGGAGGAGGATGSGGSGSSTISKNALDADDESVAVSNDAAQNPIDSTRQEYEPLDGDLDNTNTVNTANVGREHLDMEATDNTAALRAQIKQQADLETGPEIKAELMKAYEELK